MNNFIILLIYFLVTTAKGSYYSDNIQNIYYNDFVGDHTTSCTQKCLNYVDIQDVKTLNFHRKENTITNKTISIPQLLCTGGDCYPYSQMLTFVKCENYESDKLGKKMWKCVNNLNPEIAYLDNLVIKCEGDQSGSNNIILENSCSLEYTFHITKIGTVREAPYDDSNMYLFIFLIFYFLCMWYG